MDTKENGLTCLASLSIRNSEFNHFSLSRKFNPTGGRSTHPGPGFFALCVNSSAARQLTTKHVLKDVNDYHFKRILNFCWTNCVPRIFLAFSWFVQVPSRRLSWKPKGSRDSGWYAKVLNPKWVVDRYIREGRPRVGFLAYEFHWPVGLHAWVSRSFAVVAPSCPLYKVVTRGQIKVLPALSIGLRIRSFLFKVALPTDRTAFEITFTVTHTQNSCAKWEESRKYLF